MVEHKSQNMMVRDILTKLGLTLTQQQANKGKKLLNISENIIEQNITKWIFKNTPTFAQDRTEYIMEQIITKLIFKNYPHLCLGKSKNHIAKSILKKEKTSKQHKGRRIHLHLVEK